MTTSTMVATGQIGSSPEAKTPAGNEIPIFDPSQETVSFMGHTFAIGDTRISAQFEAYLSSSSHSTLEARKYRKTIDTILHILRPTSKERTKIKKAYFLLHEAASYRGDGNICDSLSNGIHTVINAQNHIQARKDSIEALEQEKKRILRILKIIENRPDFNVARKVGSKPNKSKNINSSEYRNYKKRLVEIEILKRKRSAETNVSLTEAKIQFQALLLQLFMQRRFEHVVIGCRFHNELFRKGDGKIHIKRGSDIDKFFADTIGVDPTIAGLDSIANEAIAKVNGLVDAFKSHLKMSQIHSASRKLLESYAIGEFIATVQTLPMEQKQHILQYVKDSNKLVSAIDAKNFVLAMELNESLKSQADDYNFAKTDSAIRAYTNASNHHVNMAYQAYAEQDKEEASNQIFYASQLWPNNPRIVRFRKITQSKIDKNIAENDEATKAQNDFDEAFRLRKRRYIMHEDRAPLFAAIFRRTEDQQRMDQFLQIKKQHTQILKALEVSEIHMDNRQFHAAWETLHQLDSELKEDKIIRKHLTALHSKSSRFITTITLGNHFMAESNYGTALTYYLKARTMYPKSKIANKCIADIISYKTSGTPIRN